MPTAGEHKTVQARLLEYAEAIGWTLLSREGAEKRFRATNQAHCRHTLENIDTELGLFGIILRHAQNKISKPSDFQRVIKMIADENLADKDDEKALYDLLGNKDERKKFDTQFKKAESNFKIAIVVDRKV
jgi:hypothetical protein